MNITDGTYLSKFSLVISHERFASVNHVAVLRRIILELNNSRKVHVIQGLIKQGAENGLEFTRSQVIPITSMFFRTRQQVDFIVRFNTGNQVDSREIDDIVAYAWNVTVGAPMIPSGDPNHAGRLFSMCDRSATREAQGGIGTDKPYYQLCSEYTLIREESQGSVGPTGSVIDRLISNPVADSSDANAIGTNPHASTDYRQLSRDAWNNVANTVNPSGRENGEGLNSNDIKFIAYAGVGILALVAISSAIKTIKKGF